MRRVSGFRCNDVVISRFLQINDCFNIGCYLEVYIYRITFNEFVVQHKTVKKYINMLRYCLLVLLTLVAGKWGREEAWCTHHTLSLISQFEGFVSKAYRCPAGVPTVGYGHVVEKGESFSDMDLTQDQALELLRSDLISANDIRPYLISPDSLKPHELDAITSLTYNMGYPEIGRSLLIKHINENNIEAAYDFFAPWRGINDKIIPGLIKRRLVELMVFANRSFDPKSRLLPSEQWGILLKYTDENWTILRKIDSKSGSGLLEEAVKIFREYQASKARGPRYVKLSDRS